MMTGEKIYKSVISVSILSIPIKLQLWDAQELIINPWLKENGFKDPVALIHAVFQVGLWGQSFVFENVVGGGVRIKHCN